MMLGIGRERTLPPYPLNPIPFIEMLGENYSACGETA
jgi:hypothetical protein